MDEPDWFVPPPIESSHESPPAVTLEDTETTVLAVGVAAMVM